MSIKILVVDDEPRYVRLMEANLISEGYQVLKAYDGQGAVEMVAEDQPDLVLLDVMMPGLNGFGACERIREFSSVPIIMVTAKGEEQDRVHGLDVGADDYIVKPFMLEDLMRKIEHYKEYQSLRKQTSLYQEYMQNLLHDIESDFDISEITTPLVIETNYQRLVDKIVFEHATQTNTLLTFIPLSDKNWKEKIQKSTPNNLLYITEIHQLKNYFFFI